MIFRVIYILLYDKLVLNVYICFVFNVIMVWLRVLDMFYIWRYLKKRILIGKNEREVE